MNLFKRYVNNLELGNIKLVVNKEQTIEFYKEQFGFTCDCPNCLRYVANIPEVKSILKGIDEELGIDLNKDVGQGMDELMPVDYEDHHLDVIPYYVVGKCYVDSKELDQQPAGPIWPTTIRATAPITENLKLLIINTSGGININDNSNVLTIWFEYKTETK